MNQVELAEDISKFISAFPSNGVLTLFSTSLG